MVETLIHIFNFLFHIFYEIKQRCQLEYTNYTTVNNSVYTIIIFCDVVDVYLFLCLQMTMDVAS